MIRLAFRLEQLREKYEDNFQKLSNSVGKKRQNCYLKRERKLNKRIKKLQDKLGLSIKDPCMLRNPTSCVSCGGYYRVITIKVDKKTKVGWKKYIKTYYMIARSKKGKVVKCEFNLMKKL